MKLDDDISQALARLNVPAGTNAADSRKYIEAFQKSAQEKAQAVLDGLAQSNEAFRKGRPIFLSIGGGSGDELVTLLEKSNSSLGLLVEKVHELVEIARKRVLRAAKRLEIFEGDAKSTISQAVETAASAIRKGDADFLAISCHAVIHELYDRSPDFDVIEFFGTLFKHNEFPIWFTCREPGAPEKWPEKVLLRAECDPKSILSLANAITTRHSSLSKLKPPASVLGDDVYMNKTLAMEVLAKLPYLDDLPHEIEERSTSIEHRVLQSALMLAIGNAALQEHRAFVKTVSAPTASFEKHWKELSIEVKGIDDRCGTAPLAVAESQTRLVGWRVPIGSQVRTESGLPQPTKTELPASSQPAKRQDLTVAEEALREQDTNVLTALILSRGRRWIESPQREAAIHVLEEVRRKYSTDSLQSLWAHYLLSLVALFSGQFEPGLFTEAHEKQSHAAGLGLLFHAERMEFCRKTGRLNEAVNLANTLVAAIPATVLDSATDLERYVVATSRFVFANLLRYGGQYRRAWEEIDSAERIFRPSIESHATELAHCHYAKTICVAMTGLADFELHLPESERHNQRFASALIDLAYSHAEWVVGDVSRAAGYANNAAVTFASIGSPHYADRARLLAWLLRAWQEPSILRSEPGTTKVSSVASHLRTLVADENNLSALASSLSKERASTVLGLLQFAKKNERRWNEPLSIGVPFTLSEIENGKVMVRPAKNAESLRDLDLILRQYLEIPESRRLPLITD